MNLGQSVAVVLYELIRQTQAEPARAVTEEVPATAADRERLMSVLLETLLAGGLAHRGTEGMVEEKVRRLVRRLQLSRSDVNEWLGLVRQVLWKLKSNS